MTLPAPSNFDPPSPLRVTILFWLELDCFALQIPLSRRLLPSLKERSLVKFSFVFFPIVQSQPSSLLLRAATARHPPSLGHIVLECDRWELESQLGHFLGPVQVSQSELWRSFSRENAVQA